MKKLFVLIFLFSTNLLAKDFSLPNPPSSGIGDMGTFYLAQPSFFSLHLMNNDWIGGTDKLMTGSASLFYHKKLNTWNDGENSVYRGVQFSIHRRIITPILKTKFNTSDLSTPVGFYADWFEFQTAYSHVWKNYKVELSLSLDDFGNFDGHDIQSRIHQIIGSSDESSRYGNDSKGSYGAGSVGAGYLFNEDALLMLYFQKNEIMQAWDARFSYAKNIGEFNYAFQVNLVSQDYSDLYKEITKYRYDWGISAKYKWWQGNFGYVSKYLQKDEYGQFFINPLIIHFMF